MLETPLGINSSKNPSTTSGSDASRTRASPPDSEMTVKEEKNIPQSATPSEEEIRIAVIQAQCNQDVGRSQKLYDLEAQYQKPLVAKNQAALENELKEFKRRDEQFKQYVLDNQ